jgi:hypothetical protein
MYNIYSFTHRFLLFSRDILTDAESLTYDYLFYVLYAQGHNLQTKQSLTHPF